MFDFTFIKFNQNHYVDFQLYGGHVLLVASQILLGSFLVVNHPVL
jgi:hypothetical protein